MTIHPSNPSESESPPVESGARDSFCPSETEGASSTRRPAYLSYIADGAQYGLTLRDVCYEIQAGRIWILLSMLGFLILGLIYLSLTPSFYRASMMIGPAATSTALLSPSHQTFGSFQPQLESSVAGYETGLNFTLSSSGSMPLPLTGFEAVMTGHAVAGLLAANPSIMKAIRRDPRYKQKNAIEGQTNAPLADNAGQASYSPAYSVEQTAAHGARFSFQSPGRSQIPAQAAGDDSLLASQQTTDPAGHSFSASFSADLALYLDRTVTIKPAGNSVLRTISYDHPDPFFAAHLPEILFAQADALLRREDIMEIEGRIGYLHETMNETNNPDQRRILAQLLLLEEQRLMLTSAGRFYAARIIDPPAAPTRPSWPRPFLVMTLCALCGMIFGFVLFQLARAVRG